MSALMNILEADQHALEARHEAERTHAPDDAAAAHQALQDALAIYNRQFGHLAPESAVDARLLKVHVVHFGMGAVALGVDYTPGTPHTNTEPGDPETCEVLQCFVSGRDMWMHLSKERREQLEDLALPAARIAYQAATDEARMHAACQ